MKIHLFASAAAAAFLALAAPAHSQILGGGARGGIAGAFGNSFGPSSLRTSAMGESGAQLGTRIDASRAERAAKTGTRTAAHGSETRTAEAGQAAHTEAQSGVASAASVAARADRTASTAAASGSEAGARTATQGEAQSRGLDSGLGTSAAAGGHRASGIGGMSTAAQSQPARQAAPKGERPQRSDGRGDSGQPGRPAAAQANGQASASASVNAQ